VRVRPTRGGAHASPVPTQSSGYRATIFKHHTVRHSHRAFRYADSQRAATARSGQGERARFEARLTMKYRRGPQHLIGSGEYGQRRRALRYRSSRRRRLTAVMGCAPCLTALQTARPVQGKRHQLKDDGRTIPAAVRGHRVGAKPPVQRKARSAGDKDTTRWCLRNDPARAAHRSHSLEAQVQGPWPLRLGPSSLGHRARRDPGELQDPRGTVASTPVKRPTAGNQPAPMKVVEAER
jgi:hypothetical protein